MPMNYSQSLAVSIVTPTFQTVSNHYVVFALMKCGCTCKGTKYLSNSLLFLLCFLDGGLSSLLL